MLFIDPQSFLLGAVFGIGVCGVAVGFTAALFTFSGADKRGLSGRHRPEARHEGELPATLPAALPVLAPRKSRKPGIQPPYGLHPRP